MHKRHLIALAAAAVTSVTLIGLEVCSARY